ncbi:3-oxoacyl-ACP reductase [Demequina aurantiaca]|uniref:3-oxoacyl-ACP reductase n=1 Tax=Demequina aurantiaca TaxID=676200 RepID=UPI0007855866|nr:3-oxoacyl-ACP reductase [Demequina aurantiaca]
MGALEKLFYSPVGHAVSTRAGLADPPQLRRGRTWPDGTVVLAPLGASTLVADTLDLLGLESSDPIVDAPADSPPGYGSRIGALVIDAMDLTTIVGLEDLRAVLRPAVRALEGSGRIVIVAREASGDWEAKSVTRALDGINRTVGKELRRGATSNLVYVAADASASNLVSTLGFVLQGRSAFVDGQTWHVSDASSGIDELIEKPLQDRVVVVTGAARGIGASIARILARDGATIVGVDIPAAGESLAEVANEVGGTALQLDITADDAGAAIAEHVARRGERIYGVVHCAGITRDKMLVNTDADRWGSVLDVNLAAQIRMNEVLLDPAIPGSVEDGGRIVGIASTSGLAGNKGQTNYAASKAGVTGLVEAMAPDLASRGITANAVAPGFIETAMTARIPFIQREIFRRSNSLSQGGQPEDVAEAIGYLLDPASAGVNGQVIRVCGQNLVGA